MDEALLGYVEKIDQLNERLRAEIDRLTAEKSGWDAQFERLLNRAVKAEQNAERLRSTICGFSGRFVTLAMVADALRPAEQSVSGERK